MPWINGRFYANPLFGRALERARAAESGRVWSEQYPELGFQPIVGLIHLDKIEIVPKNTPLGPVRH
jgi:hypothetical protein